VEGKMPSSTHEFLDLPDASSGYDYILGDDFVHPYIMTVEYQDTVVKAGVFTGKASETVVLQRKVPAPTKELQVMNISGSCQSQSGHSKTTEGPGSW
jgi:hypothetical protein